MRLVLLAIAAPLIAQIANPLTTYFVPTNEFVGPFERISITICNNTSTPQIHTGPMLMRDAAINSIRIATHAEMLRAGVRAEAISKPRLALLVLEIAGTGFTVLMAGDVIDINEPGYKIVAPVAAVTIRALTTYYQSQEYTPPVDMRPPVVTVPADTCVDHAIYGTRGK